MQSQHQPASPIVFLGPNKKGGRDYVIADIHGTRDCFYRLLLELKAKDRLFIAGDMLDRGDDNVEIVETMLGEHDYADMPVIYAVRGNHEQMALDTILEFEQLLVKKREHYKVLSDSDYTIGLAGIIENALETAATDDTGKDLLAMAKTHAFAGNGGMWLRELYLAELEANAIYYANGKINYTNDSKVKKVKEFIESLPYAIHVSTPLGENDFIIGHAAIPFADAMLQQLKQDKNPTLSADQINYLLWARTNNGAEIQIEDKGRNSFSTFALVGHNIFALQGNSAVYPYIATANLDGGSYLFNFAVCVCMNDKSIHIIPDDETIPVTILKEDIYPLEQSVLTLLLDQINPHWPGEYQVYFNLFCTEILKLCKLMGFQASLKNEILAPLVAQQSAVMLDEKIIAIIAQAPLAGFELTYKTILQCLINNSALTPSMSAELAEIIKNRAHVETHKLNPAQQFSPTAKEAITQELNDILAILPKETPAATVSSQPHQK